MPTIFKPKKKVYKRVRESSKKDNEIHKFIYNTQIWKRLRIEYLKENPLCSICLENGKINSAVEVHHIIEISKGKDIFEKQALGFDYNNLMGLCTECHKEQHKKNINNN